MTETQHSRTSVRSFLRVQPAVLVVCASIVAGCGGSGGSADPGPSPPVPPPPAPPATSGIDFDGELLLETGEPWTGQVITWGAASAASLSLTNGPAGMQFDPTDGVLRWTPPSGVAGEVIVEVTAQFSSDTWVAATDLHVIGLREVTRETVGPNGGSITLLDPSGDLDGGYVEFPAGALASAQEIVIASAEHGSLLPPGAVTAEVGPSQPLGAPVTVALPYDAGVLAAQGAAADDLRLYVWSDDEGWTPLADGYVDTANQLVVGRTDHFSPFTILSDAIESVTGAAERAYLEAMGFVNATRAQIATARRRLVQPRGIVTVMGDGVCEPEERTAILIHGILSHSSTFDGPLDLVASLSGRYDNILAYNYPSGDSLASNGHWLAMQLFSDKTRFVPGAIVDVYAHSMGGLVSRFAMEIDYPLIFGGGIYVANLVTLGSPHRGTTGFVPGSVVSNPTIEWILDVIRDAVMATRGAADLIPGSPFLGVLNASPAIGWTRYHCVAGASTTANGEASDGVVPESSAIPTGLFPIAWQTTVGQHHTQLHDEYALGAGPGLAAVLVPKRFYADGVEVLSRDVQISWSSGPGFDVLQARPEVRFAEDFMVMPSSFVGAGLGITCAGSSEESFVLDFLYLTDGRIGTGVVGFPGVVWTESLSGRTHRFDTTRFPYGLMPCEDVLNGFNHRLMMGFAIPDPTNSSSDFWRDLTL